MESVESINRQLIDLYGLETAANIAMFRVVWSDDQREKRYGTYRDFTREGIFIREVTEVREAPKYQWIPHKYVLERLCVVPDVNKGDLPTSKLSYEPIWVFETQSGHPLPPRVDASKLIIDTLYAALGKKSVAKYTPSPEELDPELRIRKLQEELFGNETPATDALAYGHGVTNPWDHKKVIVP